MSRQYGLIDHKCKVHRTLCHTCGVYYLFTAEKLIYHVITSLTHRLIGSFQVSLIPSSLHSGGPAIWKVTVSGELRFMTSYLESSGVLIVTALSYPNYIKSLI